MRVSSVGVAARDNHKGNRASRYRVFFDPELEEIKMASTAQKSKTEKVMHEYKEGKLKSGSGGKVKSRKQAVAIAMSESGQSKSRKKTG
jgi:Family of unknown function (DUF6496)